MARLLFSAICSLDGYIADEQGDFEWGAPDEEVHSFVNDIERSVGTYLYGRRMYEVMQVWQHPEEFADGPIALDYAAVWQSADKVVYSTTLESVATPRTQLVRAFDPAEVLALKQSAVADLSIGGPHIAAEAMRAGIVDEISLYLVPVVVGGGTRALPPDLRLDLRLLEERRFAAGTVYVRYAVGS